MLGGVEKVLLAVLLVVLMVGMGATLQPSDFMTVARRPKAALVGLCSQFGWMPAIAGALAWGLNLPGELALGLVLVGCTPGGTTSNMFTYFARGDVALSIAMTALSTAVAVVAMPAVLWLYARPLGGHDVTIPYASIVTTLMLVLLPLALGMAIRARSVAAAMFAERTGACCGIGVLVLLIISTLARNAQYFSSVPIVGYFAALLLGVLGLVLGHLGAGLVGLGLAQRRAVSFETGIQNSPLAFAIILGSFPAEHHDAMLQLPLLYALFILLSASALTLFFRFRNLASMTEPA